MFEVQRLAFAVPALVAALAAPAAADFGDKNPITVTVTGATPSGYPRAMVEGLNAIVRDAYPNSSISFKPNSPGGGLIAISDKEADFTATATGTEIALANAGQAPYAKSYKGQFSYAFRLFDNQFLHFLMTKSWADANGIKSWADIAAKKPKIRLAINRIDNPQTTLGGPYELMKAHGFAYQDIQKWGGSYILGNSSVGLDAIVDGKADMFMNARTLGDSLVKDIAGKRELLWIEADPEMVRKAAAVYGFKMDMVKAGTYPFMAKDYPTIRQWAAYLAGAHVSDETVYKFVKSVAEAEDRVRKIGGSLRDFKAQDMAQKDTDLPYHPGALRYYREKGWVK